MRVEEILNYFDYGDAPPATEEVRRRLAVAEDLEGGVSEGYLARQRAVLQRGDDIRGDIEASQQTGLKAILVRTGKFSEADLNTGITPDVIIDSVEELPEWWLSNMQ